MTIYFLAKQLQARVLNNEKQAVRTDRKSLQENHTVVAIRLGQGHQPWVVLSHCWPVLQWPVAPVLVIYLLVGFGLKMMSLVIYLLVGFGLKMMSGTGTQPLYCNDFCFLFSDLRCA